MELEIDNGRSSSKIKVDKFNQGSNSQRQEKRGSNLFESEMNGNGTNGKLGKTQVNEERKNLLYDVGEALGVHGHNDEKACILFLNWYGQPIDDIIAIKLKGPKDGAPRVHVRTVLQVFVQILDLFGRPSKRFYEQLSHFARDPKEKDRLQYLSSSEGVEHFKKKVEDSVTYADILREFPSAHPTIPELCNIIPEILPRHYSIASSMKAHPTSVHLLIVTNTWTSPSGELKIAQCTRYLQELMSGDTVVCTVKPSVMILPTDHETPIAMAGLGTGMAPFRAFIEERVHMRDRGMRVGPIGLYFGSRSRFAEYLYGEEIEAYHKSGLITYLGLAFSRDQPQNIYIQHKMAEHSEYLVELLGDEDVKIKTGAGKNGWFYLCGPTWPAGDVQDAITNAFVQFGGLDESNAKNIVKKMKNQGRYILEVY
eukprot:TRINITY_DN1768_c0_g2_i1.p1 TRINITY_DN1768_c0_g2~~TRINITY_DN1768_c0_g2_i1.p1  ORF type:complete len:425 (-),score=94.22 TRINITY_DN1768_c0_g2_i1:56-1330(-)